MRRHMSLVAVLMIAIVVSMPVCAGASPVKQLERDGSVPARWDMPKPEIEKHPDNAPTTAGGDGSGDNKMNFSYYESGDMIIALGTLTGHAGEWDSAYYSSIYSRCVWSANTTPVNGVQLETPMKYRGYDYAYGIWVPSLSYTKRAAARNYCRYQKGEPYVISSSKSDQSHWYCSKLLWSSYRYTSYIDLDADGGYWVWPVDLLNDTQTTVFAYAA